MFSSLLLKSIVGKVVFFSLLLKSNIGYFGLILKSVAGSIFVYY